MKQNYYLSALIAFNASLALGSTVYKRPDQMVPSTQKKECGPRYPKRFYPRRPKPARPQHNQALQQPR